MDLNLANCHFLAPAKAELYFKFGLQSRFKRNSKITI